MVRFATLNVRGLTMSREKFVQNTLSLTPGHTTTLRQVADRNGISISEQARRVFDDWQERLRDKTPMPPQPRTFPSR